MIVTEEEAKTKRCQETFGPVSYATVTHSPADPFGHSFSMPAAATMPVNCIGSACMAWRFLTREDERRLGQDEVCVYSDADIELEAFGYCGKAGHP